MHFIARDRHIKLPLYYFHMFKNLYFSKEDNHVNNKDYYIKKHN